LQERIDTPGKVSAKGQVESKALQQAGWFEVMAAFCPALAESASAAAVYKCLQTANKAKRIAGHAFARLRLRFFWNAGEVVVWNPGDCRFRKFSLN
jgi:hypothetical protein